MACKRTDDLGRNFFAITFPHGTVVACPILQGNTDFLRRCIECGYFNEGGYILKCDDYLCEHCFGSHMKYIGQVDLNKTQINRAQEQISLPPRVQKIVLECPGCWEPQYYMNIKEHIKTKHPRIFEQGYTLSALKEQLKGRPILEPNETTAAMGFKEKYSLKDVKGLADGILIPFKEKLNPELACCICKALTPTGLKDGKGHTYCAYCTRVHTDALGRFTCSLCGW